MLNEKKSISFWLISLALLTFLFLIQSFYPKYIDQLYSQKSFAVLNHLTLSHDEHSLEYYRGKINDLLIGPVYSFITGVIFFLFAFVYLRGAKGWHIGIAVFVYLFLTRRNILTFPPYGDALVGPFSDAIWLLRHQFNYPAYWQVDSFLTGGPQVYPTSIYPGFLAVLMKVAPSAKVFLIIMHLLSFAMAAGVIALFRAVLQRIMDQDLALIGSFLLLSHPLFQSMSELINMEMPSVLFALLAIFALINQRMYWACCMAFISLMIKGPGAIACLCVFLGSVILYFAQSKGERKWLPMVVSGILCVFVLIKMKVRNAIIGGNVSHNNISFLSGWYLVKDKLYFWIFLLIALGLCLRLGYVYWKREKGMRQIFMDYFTPGMMVLTAGLWFLVHANFSALIYRYELLLLPFLLFTFIYIFYLVFNNSGFLKG
ncbi:MAG: hypothetical protein KC733_09330, partial [Candidatus Omnitrophica bacterium]|nr:hypothetical protein [Candidatus Omnitrophota bacterium]